MKERTDWYKDAIIYELRVRSFHDSNGDGFGDLPGLTAKLDDFKAFVAAAHERGLRVITELVLNHTSDRHPWFQRARSAPPGHPDRAWYVWSVDAKRYAGARVIFKDFEESNWAWDEEAKAWFGHRFYSHQPEANAGRWPLTLGPRGFCWFALETA